MKAIVSVIMGSTSDLPVMKKATDFLNEMQVPFEVNALSAHRTPEAVEAFAKGAKERGIKIIIAAAGMAAHLPGVIAASTTLPVIGVPINSTLDGMDALLAIVQMPPGIPVATVGINGALNAGILAVQMLSLADDALAERLAQYKDNLKKKIEKANEELKGESGVDVAVLGVAGGVGIEHATPGGAKLIGANGDAGTNQLLTVAHVSNRICIGPGLCADGNGIFNLNVNGFIDLCKGQRCLGGNVLGANIALGSDCQNRWNYPRNVRFPHHSERQARGRCDARSHK